MEEPDSSTTEAPVRGERRRKRIVKALHDCVVEQGYAQTTLADVARRAEMSPSHLLYYFDGTDAILAYYFSIVTRRLMKRLEGLTDEPPEKQIDLLADLFFAGSGIHKSEIGFMLECFGVAVHNKLLRSEKTAIDRFCKNYLRHLFEQFPTGPSDPGAAAEIAYAMLVGLRTAAYFDDRLGRGHARRLFHGAMLDLARPAGRGADAPPLAP